MTKTKHEPDTKEYEAEGRDDQGLQVFLRFLKLIKFRIQLLEDSEELVVTKTLNLIHVENGGVAIQPGSLGLVCNLAVIFTSEESQGFINST